MTCAWSGSVEEFKRLVNTGTYVEKITDGFNRSFHKATESEITAWRESLPKINDLLFHSRMDNLQIIIEMQMPVGAERADVILLGGSNQSPKAMVIELKQWSRISIDPDTFQISVPGIGFHQHPSIQSLNYTGKLRFFNSRAHTYDLEAAVLAHNASKDDLYLLNHNSIPEELLRDAPIYGEEDINELVKRIEDFLLPCSLFPDEHVNLIRAEYQQSSHLFTFLRNKSKEIAQNAYLAIANCGMGLTIQQDRILNEVLTASTSNEKIDFIIQGGPGSGKTLLAISLLLKAAERGISCIFALRNNRLMKILRSVLDQAYPGVSGMMIFFKPMFGGGLNGFTGKVDLLVCDEAQRIDNVTINKAPKIAKVSAFFLDQTQRLNPPEFGTIVNFTEVSRSAQKTPEYRELDASIRCYGGVPYHTWVEKLLSEPSNSNELSLKNQLWINNYSFDTTNTFDELVEKLKYFQSDSNRIALVASFTESPGVNGNKNAPDNYRIGYPLTSGFDLYRDSEYVIPWLMSPDEYVGFWMKGNSNKLDMVASIYGTQGFESDYVGVVWGRDLVISNGEWTLGDPNNCYDTIDRLVTGKVGNRKWSEDALNLVINRYRIFLTRGIKGTFVYCEDENTRNYLKEIIG